MSPRTTAQLGTMTMFVAAADAVSRGQVKRDHAVLLFCDALAAAFDRVFSANPKLDVQAIYERLPVEEVLETLRPEAAAERAHNG